MKATIMLAAGLLAQAGLAQAALAADVRVLTGGAFKPVLLAVAPAFERATGHRLVVDNDTVGALARRIRAGERFDVAIVTPSLAEEFAREDRVAPASRRDLARVAVGVAVREGAPSPEIGTVDAFKAAILAAPSVAYIDPASGGSSGVYLAGLFDRMGIAGAVAAKAVLVPGGLVAERVARGEAALAIHQISEILPVKGVTLVGPLPDAIQNYTVYTAAIATRRADPEAASALVAALMNADTTAILAGKGMERPR